MTDGRVVAVTGATGFLGAHIVAALAAEGARLRILSHQRPPHELWRDLPAEIIAGSILEAAACEQLAEGADAVVHTAGLIKAHSREEFFRVNAEGTAVIAQAARAAAPASRFILISSLAGREPQLSPYAASKQAGEAAAQTVFSDRLERLVILRPPTIYGPWDREMLPIFKAARRPVAPVFGAGRVAVMHVRDAAAAIAQVALGAGAAGTYALAGPDRAAYTVRELMEEAVSAVGGHPRFLPVPAAVLRAAGLLSGWQARLRGNATIFTAGKAREMLHEDWTVTEAETLPTSVYQPCIDLGEGFRATVEWYRSAGWLPAALQ